MNNQKTKTITSIFLACCGSVLLVFSSVASSGQVGTLHFMGANDTDDLFGAEFFTGSQHPDLSGAGFPPGAHTLLVFKQTIGTASLVLLEPPKDKADRIGRTSLAVTDPINIAFDSISVGSKGSGLCRLFVWDSASNQLTTIKATAHNLMDKKKVEHFDVAGFGIHNPQGLTMNPNNGQLFVLDTNNSRIVVVEQHPGQNFTASKTISISLPQGLGELRGLAFNPADQHLYILNTNLQTLYKLTLQGDLVGHVNISGQKLEMAQGMVFAPSLDPTDDPSIFHLYVVSKTSRQPEIYEWELRPIGANLLRIN